MHKTWLGLGLGLGVHTSTSESLFSSSNANTRRHASRIYLVTKPEKTSNVHVEMQVVVDYHEIERTSPNANRGVKPR